QIARRSQLPGPDDTVAQPTGAVDRRIAFPYDEVGRQVVQQPTVARPKGALFRRAHRGNLVDDARAFGGRQDVARRRRIEHSQRDVGAVADVAEELQHALAAVQLHHRGLDVDDVGT